MGLFGFLIFPWALYSQNIKNPTFQEDEGATRDPIDEHLEGQKAIVFVSCLLQLIGICQVVGCGSMVDPENKRVTQHGAVIIIRYTCNNHHSGEWCSSPTVGKEKSKVWVLNTVLASYCLTCGLHISQVQFLILVSQVLPWMIVYDFSSIGPWLLSSSPNLRIWQDLLLQFADRPSGEDCVDCLVWLSGVNKQSTNANWFFSGFRKLKYRN